MSCKFTRLVRACWCTCGERKWALGTLQSTTPLQKHTVPKLAKFFDFFRISHQAKIITSHFQPSTIKIFSIRLACRAVRANQALRTRTAMINAQLTNQITFDHLVKTTILILKAQEKITHSLQNFHALSGLHPNSLKVSHKSSRGPYSVNFSEFSAITVKIR